MTICERVRFSNTTSDFESPTLMSLRLTVMSCVLADGALGPDPDAARRHDELARCCVAVLSDVLGELQRSAPSALLPPRGAGFGRGREHHAGTQRLVILEVLLGVQPAPAAAPAPPPATAHPSGRFLAR